MENVGNRKEKMIRENNRMLEQAKAVGLATDDMANDIKFNLKKQTDQMQNSVLKNLYSIQGETTLANRLLNIIKHERMKNRLIMYGVIGMISMVIIIILYNFIF